MKWNHWALKAHPTPEHNFPMWLARVLLWATGLQLGDLDLPLCFESRYCFQYSKCHFSSGKLQIFSLVQRHSYAEACFRTLFITLGREKERNRLWKNYICSLNALPYFNFRKGSFLAVPCWSIWNALTLRQMLRIKQLNRHQLFSNNCKASI